MPLNSKTFFTRLGSAAVFSAIMLLAFLSNEWAFIALFLLVNILCLYEYSFIVQKILNTQFSRNEKMNFYFIGVSVYLFVCSSFLIPCVNKVCQLMNHWMFYFLGLLIGSLLMFFAFRKNKKSIYLLTGIGYISLSFALLVQLRYQSILLPIILLLFIWMNDTLAYLTGSLFGKTKYIPSISPNKTLEGTIGGFLFTLAFASVWGYYTDWFPVWQWLVFSLIAALVGTIGDLAESKLKRMADIKDSGNLMPGHGGALDRFDSLILAAPVAFLFAILCMKCLEMKIF